MIPKHVAFIMDGNRRWAKGKGMAVYEGHKVGEERLEPIIDEAINLGITHLTFWAFSTENWKRSQDEVSVLLALFRRQLEKHVDRFHQKNVRLVIIGDIGAFPKDIQKKTAYWMEKTKDNTTITVNIALSYGGRDEIIRAIRKMEREAVHGKPFGDQGKREVMQNEFGDYLDTAGQPDPDLLIRTGGEQRLSGFMLWQMEYAELYFTETLWPDFTPDKFREAIEEYESRQRRFGK